MPNTYNTVGQYLDELESTKSNIKRALEDKGATVTGGLSSYADAISNLPTGTPSKPKIYNGFRFTGGDISLVDFSQYDWGLVYDTSSFFENCSHSTGDWSNFESGFNGEILSGYRMFNQGGGFTSIPQLDTSKVTDMREMFYSCNKITSIPQLDTSKVTDMYRMFSFCTSLISIPQLDTSKVTDMKYMFNYCNKLTSVPQLDTSNVMDMNGMFYQCQALTSIPQLDISNVTDMKEMFCLCSKLESVRLKGNPGKINEVSSMFNHVTTVGTLYYDDRYDYSKIISVIPSNWTAVSYNVEEYESTL